MILGSGLLLTPQKFPYVLKTLKKLANAQKLCSIRFFSDMHVAVRLFDPILLTTKMLVSNYSS